MFVIKTCRMNQNKIVGHLPRKISRAAKFFLDRGANVTHLSSAHCRRSPLFQGCLEITCTVKVYFPASIKADMLIGKYKKIVKVYISNQRMKLLSAVSSKRMIMTKTKT